MHRLPPAADLHSLAVRTDFSDEGAWLTVRSLMTTRAGMFRANLTIVDDRQYEGLSIEDFVQLASGTDHGFIFLVDRQALADPEHPVLVVDLVEEPGRSFRVIPPAMWSVQNNLVIANVDWEDFAGAVDGDGVFRGDRT